MENTTAYTGSLLFTGSGAGFGGAGSPLTV
jgi:hypothetical protein